MNRVCLLVTSMFLVFLLAACVPKSSAPVTARTENADTRQGYQTTPIPNGETWQSEWENVKAGARKEGKVVISSGAGAVLRTVMVEPFREKFQVTIEVLFGLPSEVIPKIMAERRAGLYTADIFLTSPATLVGTLKPAGVLRPLDQVIFLPEALDKRAWYLGDLPWVDKDHHMLALLAFPSATVLINTNLVKREEVQSYRSLLDPKWKSRIIMYDPTKAGQSNSWMTALAEGIMDLGYIREFARQEPVITRDERLIVDWVTQGKYPIAVGSRKEIVIQFKEAGAPIELITPREGTHVSTGSAGMVLLKNAAHPNSAKLFINWILTKEGETLLSRAQGAQSARVDVPTDFLDPLLIRQPGVRYYNSNTEDSGTVANKYVELAKEIFAPSLK